MTSEKSPETGGYLAFKEIASSTLGWQRDEVELIPLASILQRIDALYSDDLARFDAVAARIERYDRFYQDLDSQLDQFCTRIREIAALSQDQMRIMRCVPLERAIFKAPPNSETYRRFCATHKDNYRFNETRGMYLFDFMLAHFMEESAQFERLNRGLRAKTLAFARNLESSYSVWENNVFGRIFTLPGADIPKAAYASACSRLIDGLYLAVDFKPTYVIFKKHLNPLSKFPTQLLYQVIVSDSKTLLQEFTQATLGVLPRYEARQSSGEQHAPVFSCTVSFGKRTFEGTGGTKASAEAAAARAATDFLMENDRRNMPRLLADTISAGTQRMDNLPISVRRPMAKIEELRRAVDMACSTDTILKCLTLRADVGRYSLSHSATNENFAFCGSSLALSYYAETLPTPKAHGLLLHQGILSCIKEARRSVFPRSEISLSEKYYLDIFQALLYSEFLQSGYKTARKIFERCIVVRGENPPANDVGQYQAGVFYSQLLQEFTQQFAGELPTYHYVLTNPAKLHAPIYRCRSHFRGLTGEALGESKSAARQKAAYELLKKLLEDARSAQPS